MQNFYCVQHNEVGLNWRRSSELWACCSEHLRQNSADSMQVQHHKVKLGFGLAVTRDERQRLRCCVFPTQKRLCWCQLSSFRPCGNVDTCDSAGTATCSFELQGVGAVFGMAALAAQLLYWTGTWRSITWPIAVASPCSIGVRTRVGRVCVLAATAAVVWMVVAVLVGWLGS